MPTLNITVGALKSKILLDSGNLFGSSCSEDFVNRLPPEMREIQPLPDVPNVTTAKQGQGLKVVGKLKRPLRFKIQNHPEDFSTDLFVLRGLTMPVNLGYHFMEQNDVSLLPAKKTVSIRGQDLPLPLIGKIRNERDSGVYITQKCTIPPNSSVLVNAHLSNLNALSMYQDGLVAGSTRFSHVTDTHPWTRGVVVKPSMDGCLQVGVINSLDDPVTIEKGTYYGTFEALNTWTSAISSVAYPSEPSIIANNKEDKPEPTTVDNLEARVNELENMLGLTGEDCILVKDSPEYLQFMSLLLRYYHLFAFDGKPGFTDLVQHEINLIPGAKPVKNKYRPINPILEKHLKAQIDKWMTDGVIEEANSPWNAALVPVMKSDRSVRFCLDFRLEFTYNYVYFWTRLRILTQFTLDCN